MASDGGRRRAHLLAFGLGALAVAEVIAAVVMSVAVRWSWQQTLGAFVATNAVMGAAFAICGSVIAWHRPSNPIGWLLVADGLGHATSAAATPLTQALVNAHAALGVQRLAATVFAWSWPWSIGLFLPLALLLFPDGRLPTPRWRPVLIGIVATAPLFVIETGTSPAPALTGLPTAFLTLPGYHHLAVVWTVSELRTSAAVLVALAGLIVRYRRSGETQRRQLLWLLLATILVMVVIVPWSFVAGTPVGVLFAIPLIPVAIAVAVLRHQLLDIRLVVSRALSFLLLSGIVIGAYAGVVVILDQFVAQRLGQSAVAAVVVALAASPLLPRLQRLVERTMYGDRRNPAHIASRLGREMMAEPDGNLSGLVGTVRQSLRIPYAAVVISGGVLAADGVAPEQVASVLLDYAGGNVGELVVGLRPGERELAEPDRDALLLVAAPLAAAIHATRLTAELQASRERIVATREEERRRLRRDLHDGLGPALTGVAMTADAAANLMKRDVDKARELLDSLRRDTRTAIADVRRLVDNLRPPDLDELGLAGAIAHRASQLARPGDDQMLQLDLDVPDELPTLPAAIEVAAYRIATEALTNVVRHARATHAVVHLRCGDVLEVDIVDDGLPSGTNNGSSTAAWRPGVGLQAMHERAAELGGSCEAGPTPNGGRVHVSIPLAGR